MDDWEDDEDEWEEEEDEWDEEEDDEEEEDSADDDTEEGEDDEDEEEEDWEDAEEYEAELLADDEEWVASGGDEALSGGGYGKKFRLNPPPRRTEIRGRDEPWWPTPEPDYNETLMPRVKEEPPRPAETLGRTLDFAGGSDQVGGGGLFDPTQAQRSGDTLKAFERFSDQGIGPLDPGLGPDVELLERFERQMDAGLGDTGSLGPDGPDPFDL